MPPTPGVESKLADLLTRLEREGVKPGLDRTRSLSARVGSPHVGLPAVLVAGTNGKGSAAALLTAFAAAAGYRTGLYTSPHLESPRERIRIDGRAIADSALLSTLERIVGTGERTPTYFEAMTIAAFLLFRDFDVDLGIIEVGLGGRLDSTNIVDPVLSIVTSIGRDHTEYLGTDLGQIAGEKAGVFRAGRPALCGPTPPAAAAVLVESATRVGARYRRVPERGASLGARDLGWRGQVVDVDSARGSNAIETPLLGRHQATNLRLAVAAAAELREAGWSRLDRDAVADGARSVFWPGRLELITRPDRPGARILLDSAHNPAAIASLTGFLRERDEPFDLLFGALADRPAEDMLDRVRAAAQRIVLTRPLSPRAWWPASDEGRDRALDGVVLEPSIAAALELALAIRSTDLLVVSGSIFVVGPVRAELVRRWPDVVASAAECDVARGGRTRATAQSSGG